MKMKIDRKMKDRVSSLLSGMAMGSADVVPGISGGSIALILGIYKRLLKSIDNIAKSFNKEKIFSKRKDERDEAISDMDLGFIIPLVLGVGTTVFIFSNIITYLIENHPIPIYSFFSGLIIAAALVLLRSTGSYRRRSTLSLFVGILIGFGITSLTVRLELTGFTIIFISGVIGIAAMLLPGISGSFIMLMLGQYERIINAISDMDLLILLIFFAGCIVGISIFSDVLNKLMDKHEKNTKILLVGLMLGSLRYQWDLIVPSLHNYIDISIAIIFLCIGAATITTLNAVALRKGKKVK